MGMREDQALFFGKFSALMEAGMPLIKSLEVATERIRTLGLREALKRIIERAYQGSSVSDAFEGEKEYFSVEILTLLQIGEEAGDIEVRAGKIARGIADGVFIAGGVGPLRTPVSSGPLDRLLERGAELGGTELHVEPGAQGYRIRCRVGEDLRSLETQPAGTAGALLREARERAGLADDARRGAFVAGDRTVVFTCCPFEGGEGMVMDLRPRGGGAPTLEGLGLAAEQASSVRGWIREGHGLLVVSGLRFSGRSQLMAALFEETDAPRRKVVAVDPPVGVPLPGAVGIRSREVGAGRAVEVALAQLADIVLLFAGLDEESAVAATEAALSGHLVVGTFPATGAPETLVELTGRGVPPHLVAASVRGVVNLRRLAGIEGGSVPVFEVLTMTPAIRDCLGNGGDAARIREALEGEDFVPHRAAAEALIAAGRITEEEADRHF